MICTDSHWSLPTGILTTHLTGPVGVADVLRWVADLHAALALVPDGGSFRLLLNLHGFDTANLLAHKAMRHVVPMILAHHGMRPAFVDLFDPQREVPITMERDVRCTAVANVHHDAAKMNRYEQTIAKPDQRFFTDLAEARRWLQARPYGPYDLAA